MNSSGNINAIKKEIEHTLEQLNIIQAESLNLFEKVEVHTRVFHLLDVLDTHVHDLNHHVEIANPDINRVIQGLFFSVKAMKDATENLKLNAHKLEFQQEFIKPIDRIKEGLNQL